MSAPVVMESERLRAVATMNGRARCSLFLYDRSDEATPLLVEDLNLASSKDRARALEGLGDWYHEEAGGLFSRLAAVVAAEQAKPRAKDEVSNARFPWIEPWPEVVDGAALLDEIRGVLLSYVVLPEWAAEALALWLVHTYVTAVTDYTPYIRVTSPVRECGKTTLLELLFRLAHRGLLTAGVTAAALYRQIEKHAPTMLLDELDTRLRGDSGEALRGVLNSGFQRGGVVSICVGDDHEVRDFATFCPKVLAGIGRVWDTVMSRSIPIQLARAPKDQLRRLKKIRGDRIGAACLPYRRRLQRWADDNCDALRELDAVTPDELGPRQSDVWRPLLAIADLAGGHWPETGRKAALALHRVPQEEGDYGLLILEDLRALFEARGSRNLFSADILDVLGKMEERPWSEYGRSARPITANGLATLLRRFEVRPKTVRVGDVTGKGYSLDDLGTVFLTYLPTPSVPAVTAVTFANQPDVTPVTAQTEMQGVVVVGDAWETAV